MAAIIDVATITALGYIFQKFADFFYNLENKSVVPVGTNNYMREINNIRAAAREQAQTFGDTVSLAIDQAESGQNIATKIIYLLGKIKSGTSREVLEDLLDDILPYVTQQLDQSTRLKEAFEEISHGLVQVAHQRRLLLTQIDQDCAKAQQQHEESLSDKFTAIVWGICTLPTIVLPIVAFSKAGEADEKAQVAIRNATAGRDAYGVVTGLCGDIDGAINIVRQHIDSWSEILRIVTMEQKRLASADDLIRENGRVKIGVIDASVDNWTKVENAYRQYASEARQSKQVLRIAD